MASAAADPHAMTALRDPLMRPRYSGETKPDRGSAGLPGAQPRGPGLLARAAVAVKRADLHGLVDRRHQLAVLGSRLGLVALGDRGLEPAEVGLDCRGETAVLEPFTL